MKNFGIMSYNIYCNFTNYGSALQSWSTHHVINSLDPKNFRATLIDYCPRAMRDKNPLDPLKYMWDTDDESRRMLELSMPAIRENFYKFDAFYRDQFNRTKGKYSAENFNRITDEGIDGFVCGSDIIFSVGMFDGFDDGFYANYPVMRGRSISYAASCGGTIFNEKTYPALAERLKNFKAIGLRESTILDFARENVPRGVPVERTIDPTMLLTSKDFDQLATPRLEPAPYVLIYSRRYNPEMDRLADEIAARDHLKVVDISLRASNASKHRMMYEAGVEEFVSLVKHSSYVITNSFHGIIFAALYRRPFSAFLRPYAETKINELLQFYGLDGRDFPDPDFDAIHARIETARSRSKRFLKEALLKLSAQGGEI